ncbi:hypothetical protein [Alteromonas antoniana]|uniref:hypothetical protein n=1 Tax=Alteromonas antoniana TaxID=2803813 RepID=UPI001C466BC4|nr:hypothetical protein [Alteromonas antoniana]
MNSRLFPELDKLAAFNSDITQIRSFLEEMSEKGFEFGRWDGDKFYPANLELESVIHEHFGIDLPTVEKERRQVLEKLHNQ